MKLEGIKKVAVVGAGIMGHGIAQVCAQAGYRVHVSDLKEGVLMAAVDRIRSNLETLVKYGVTTKNKAESTISRIRVTVDLAEATKDVDFVVEAVPEIMRLKKQVFRDLDKLCPKRIILASNTSSFSITEIGSVTERPEKVIGTHWFRPPHITPLVEIVRGEATSDETLGVTRCFLEKLGKSPIVCRDSPGFVANRMQHVMTNEAIILLQKGIASAEDVDKAVKLGFGFRLPVVGPLEAQDFAGLDTSLRAREYEYRKLGDTKYQPPRLLRKKVEAGELGVKTGKGYYDYAKKDISSLIRKRNEQYLKLLLTLGYIKAQKEVRKT